MAAITVSMGDAPSIEYDGCVVRCVTFEATSVKVELDTREVPEGPDIILPEGTWTVVDNQDAGRHPEIVAHFKSQAEAEAAVVGLEYLDPSAVRAGRFGIDSPSED